jgi:1-acyl-sn-glycerol-3-phosphate acyltransferase
MKQILHIISYPLSVIFYVLFGLNLLIFDLVQRICLNVFGYKAHNQSVAIFNGLTLRLLHILGTTFHFSITSDIPANMPLIFVSNHQSMWDIPPLIWFLRKCHPKFISKKELGKNIPTISYNLKHGGSVLIDRKDPEQAMEQIAIIGHYISEYKRSVVIFPEGTRSRNGIPKPFKRKGLLQLFSAAPEAFVIPVSISNSWKLQKHGLFPIPLGVHLKFIIHSPIKVSEHTSEELIEITEKKIATAISN